jgi:type 1 fimbria pilin
MTVKDYCTATLITALILSCQYAVAATTTLNITGTILLPPPCVINGDQEISVNFTDEVMTTKVDGINYRQPVIYTLSCTAASANTLKMQIRGINSGFANSLQTSNTDLGIALSSDTLALPVNSWLNFNLPSQPALFATLVKRPGATLKAGVFTATATILVDYQ